jgi:tetratricopeptide (TPR) repeat protein
MSFVGIRFSVTLLATLAGLAVGCGLKAPSSNQTHPTQIYPDSLAERAKAAIDSGRPAEAMALYGKALAVEPDHQTSLLGLAELHWRANDPISARYYYQRLAQGPSPKAEYFIELARISASQSKAAEAEKTLDTAAARFPDRADLRYELGCLHLAGGHEAQARNDFQKALAIEPGHGPSLRKLSDIEFDRKNYAAALPLLERLQEAEPLDYRNNSRIAYIHFRNGDFSRALTAYRQAVSSRPASVDARIGLAVTLEKLGWTEAAVQSYTEALDHLEDGRDDVPIVLALANLLNIRGEFERTIELINQRHGSSPDDAGLACALGTALAGNGSYAEALRIFELALTDPQWSHFADTQISRIKKLRSYQDD